jgi:hypothetical protein
MSPRTVNRWAVHPTGDAEEPDEQTLLPEHSRSIGGRNVSWSGHLVPRVMTIAFQKSVCCIPNSRRRGRTTPDISGPRKGHVTCSLTCCTELM